MCVFLVLACLCLNVLSPLSVSTVRVGDAAEGPQTQHRKSIHPHSFHLLTLSHRLSSVIIERAASPLDGDLGAARRATRRADLFEEADEVVLGNLRKRRGEGRQRMRCQVQKQTPRCTLPLYLTHVSVFLTFSWSCPRRAMPSTRSSTDRALSGLTRAMRATGWGGEVGEQGKMNEMTRPERAVCGV